MRLFFDTNVIIDVLDMRERFFEASARVMNLVERGAMIGAMSANSLTDVHYILRKSLDKHKLRDSMRRLMALMEVVSLTRVECARALESDMNDFEDAALAFCALRWNADFIITRDTDDFALSPVPALSPKVFLEKYPDASRVLGDE